MNIVVAVGQGDAREEQQGRFEGERRGSVRLFLTYVRTRQSQ
jgi:hypothetical protein